MAARRNSTPSWGGSRRAIELGRAPQDAPLLFSRIGEPEKIFDRLLGGFASDEGERFGEGDLLGTNAYAVLRISTAADSLI